MLQSFFCGPQCCQSPIMGTKLCPRTSFTTSQQYSRAGVAETWFMPRLANLWLVKDQSRMAP
jgi:hypothetical protein